MIEIIPGILEQDFSQIERKIRLVEPYVKWVQIDILDGSLFNNSCFNNPKPLADLDTALFLEAHLMVKNPLKYVEPFYSVGFNRFIAHLEGFDLPNGEENVYDFFNLCRQFQAESALAIDLPTAVETLFPYLESIDQVLIMTIPTGRSGQSFHHQALKKISTIRRKQPTLPIEVDGGINSQSAPLAVKAGATRLAATSSIFGKKNVKQAIETLRLSLTPGR